MLPMSLRNTVTSKGMRDPMAANPPVGSCCCLHWQLLCALSPSGEVQEENHPRFFWLLAIVIHSVWRCHRGRLRTIPVWVDYRVKFPLFSLWPKWSSCPWWHPWGVLARGQKQRVRLLLISRRPREGGGVLQRWLIRTSCTSRYSLLCNSRRDTFDPSSFRIYCYICHSQYQKSNDGETVQAHFMSPAGSKKNPWMIRRPTRFTSR